MTLSLEKRRELCNRLWAIADGSFTKDDIEAIEREAIEHSEVAHLYAQYMAICGLLQWEYGTSPSGTPVEFDAEHKTTQLSDNAQPVVAPVFPTVDSWTLKSSANEWSIGTYIFSYSVSALVIAIGLLIASLFYVSHPVDIAKIRPEAGRYDSTVGQLSKVAPSFVGRITGMIDCEFSDENTVAVVGASVPLGRKYALTRGLMEITYNSGAKVILQGPCQYEVNDPAGGFLSLGKLTAKIEKKEGGSGQGAVASGQGLVDSGQRLVDSGQWPVAGRSAEPQNSKIHEAGLKSEKSDPQPQIKKSLFTVRTPSAIITDLGTEFGISVSKNGSMEVHVFNGRVRAQLKGVDGYQDQVAILNAGEAREYQPSDQNDKQQQFATWKKIQADRKKFETMRIESLKERHSRWLTYCEKLQADKTLVAFYKFDGVNRKDSFKLANSSATGELLDGTIIGPTWTSGRFPWKLALRFRGPESGDKVILQPQEFFNFSGAFTVAIWFKPFPGNEEQVLITKDRGSWRLLRQENPSSSNSFGVVFRTGGTYGTVGKNPLQIRGHDTIGVIPEADDKWHFVAAVYQPVDNVARKYLYIDGKLAVKDEIAARPLTNGAPVYVGYAARNEFKGIIDEIIIFARAMSSEELVEMYEIGKPIVTATPNKGN